MSKMLEETRQQPEALARTLREGLGTLGELRRHFEGHRPRLVVLVEYADASGDLTWPIPQDALAPGLHVFWAGDNKVVIGETGLKPKFAADWQRLR